MFLLKHFKTTRSCTRNYKLTLYFYSPVYLLRLLLVFRYQYDVQSAQPAVLVPLCKVCGWCWILFLSYRLNLWKVLFTEQGDKNCPGTQFRPSCGGKISEAGMSQTYWCKYIVQETGQLEPSQTSVWPAWKSNNRIKPSNNGAAEDKRWFWKAIFRRTIQELHLETYLESLTRWDGFPSFLWEWDLLKIHSSITLDAKPLRGPEWSHLHQADYWLSSELL